MRKNNFAVSASTSRPVSRMSTATFRPISRLSQRTIATSARLRSTHVQRIAGLLRTLVQQTTGVGPEDDPDEFQEYVAGALDTVLNGTGLANDMATVAKRIAGHREKARINLHHDLADAITMCYRQLNLSVSSEDRDPDDPIKRSNLPDMLHFLLELSQRPTNETHLNARDILEAVKAPPPVPEDFWKKVLEEEPFEGEHWQNQWDEDEDAKTLSSHPSLELESRRSTSTTESTSNEMVARDEKEDELLGPISYFDLNKQHVLNDAHTLYEVLCKDQYWRPGYVNAAARQAGREFNINEPATLAPSFERAIAQEAGPSTVGLREVFIDESDAVRDVLITLQGHDSVIFKFHYDGSIFRRVEPASSLPRVSHLTMTSYRSLLSAFATVATTLQHLRVFIASVFHTSMHPNSALSPTPDPSSRQHPCRTLDAFAEAVDTCLRALDEYCAGLETQICNARLGVSSATEPVIVSLLNLQRRLDNFMSRTYDILYDLTRSLPDELPAQSYAHPRSYYPTSAASTVTILSPLPLQEIYNIHPALLSKRLLDRLFFAVRACNRDWSATTTQPRPPSSNNITANPGSTHLMAVFVATAEPLWTSVGTWVKWGIDVARDALDVGTEDTPSGNDLTSDREFFVRRRDGVDVASSDFWTAGYVLRTSVSDEEEDENGRAWLEIALASSRSSGVGSRSRGLLDPRSGTLHAAEVRPKALVPDCLVPIAGQVLAAGKAVGLLRAIGVWGESAEEYESIGSDDGQNDEGESWPSFADTLKEAEAAGILDITFETGPLEDLTRYNLDDTIVADSSFPANQPSAPAVATEQDYPISPNLASEVLLNDLPHILADKISPRCQIAAFRLNRVLVEDCDLWSHLGTMENLCFMRRGDVMAHFCDVLFARIETQKPWSDYHLLNSTFRDVLSTTSTAWIDLSRFPFPLSYMFGATTLEVYSRVLVLVLQLRRAKIVLDRILVRDVGAYREELKMVYVLRGQLMWFVNTYMNFILTNVIHTQVMRFHKELAEAKSLDEMILKHQTHLETIEEQCCLRTKDAVVHKTVLSILDMCIQFGDLFASVVADTTLDLSRPPVARGARRRRDLANRNNLVTFVPPPEVDAMSATSDELVSDPGADDDVDEETELATTTTEPTFLATDDWAERVERMSKGLDGLVRSLRRAAETLAGSVGRSVGAFGMLEFALEDWDL